MEEKKRIKELGKEKNKDQIFFYFLFFLKIFDVLPLKGVGNTFMVLKDTEEQSITVLLST